MSDPIEGAASAARRGALIVLPTDTVYGIGTRPDEPSATTGLFEAKGRPAELTVPVLVPSAASARAIAAFDERAEALVLRFWAGPLTLVLPRTEASAGWALGGDAETIGVRMPHHPLALAVLARTGPLAVTSANRSGEPTPTTCDGVRGIFGDRVEVYLCESEPLEGAASTVVDLGHGQVRVLRRGSVAEADVIDALGGRGGTARGQTPR
jgi:tRNA threonylcarbamoyl adenosine modification protein (Sua5/YciO/YrdC/YwlC family)